MEKGVLKHCVECKQHFYRKEKAYTRTSQGLRPSKAKTCSKKCSLIHNSKQRPIKKNKLILTRRIIFVP